MQRLTSLAMLVLFAFVAVSTVWLSIVVHDLNVRERLEGEAT